MDYNALTAGISHDGIKNRTDIKVLVCGLLARAGEKLTASDMTDILCGSSAVNYFELLGAIDDLCSSGNITKDGGDILILTENGRSASEQLWYELPVTVREKTEAALKKVCVRRRSERENEFRVTELENGCEAECIINNGGERLMSVTLTLPDKSYVKKVRERFHGDPERLYRLVLFQLTGDASFAPED